MKKILLIFVLSLNGFAQNMVLDSIYLSRTEAEALFLEKNLTLLANRLNIDEAEAQIIQAKLWPNPTLTIDEVNLWSNSSAEQMSYITNNWGQHSQISVALEQLILTAGKRKKMIAFEQVNLEMAHRYLEDFLRNVKVEFRNTLTELQYIQKKQKIYKDLLTTIQNLLQGYKRQFEQKNISKSEYFRLKAYELEILQSVNDIQLDKNKIQKELKILLGIPASSVVVITEEGFLPNMQQLENLHELQLIQKAVENRPDLKVSELETDYFSKKHIYEKSLRTPDVNLIVNYDRGGNIMQDFFGVGIGIDLPFFNRNQGNIKIAQLETDRSKLLYEQKNIEVQSEVVMVFHNLKNTLELYKNIDEDYEEQLDLLMANYHANFSKRNLSMLEYLDFVEAYIDSKETLLNTVRTLNENYEELQFAVGTTLD